VISKRFYIYQMNPPFVTCLTSKVRIIINSIQNIPFRKMAHCWVRRIKTPKLLLWNEKVGKDGCVILTTGSQDGNVEHSEDNTLFFQVREEIGLLCFLPTRNKGVPSKYIYFDQFALIPSSCLFKICCLLILK